MLVEDEVPTEEQLNCKDWLAEEIESHEIERDVHKLKALAYKLRLSKIIAKEILEGITK